MTPRTYILSLLKDYKEGNLSVDEMRVAISEYLSRNRPLIHTGLGVYLNGDYKTNGVSTKHLVDHIDYNVNLRPGRTLVIDGFIVFLGYHEENDAGLLKALEETKDLVFDRCTAPYQ